MTTTKTFDEMREALPCRDGREPEPYTQAGLVGVRRALRFYDSDHPTARLLATIDAMGAER